MVEPHKPWWQFQIGDLLPTPVLQPYNFCRRNTIVLPCLLAGFAAVVVAALDRPITGAPEYLLHIHDV